MDPQAAKHGDDDAQQNTALESLGGLENLGDAAGADPIFGGLRLNNPLICRDDAQAFFDLLEAKYAGEMVSPRLPSVTGPTCPTPADSEGGERWQSTRRRASLTSQE